MAKKIFILILLDQITKLFFWGRDFFFGPLHIHSVKNFGLVSGLSFGTVSNLAIIAVALVFFLYYYFKHDLKHTPWGQIIFALILAGAVSNIIDRLYLGYVRDFIDIGLNFTFNLADAMVVLGLLGLLVNEGKKL